MKALALTALCVALCGVSLEACHSDPPPPKAAPDYDGIRDRAHDSHESLKQTEANKPPPTD